MILKGESTENKSTQQSWPTFVLEFFQRQHSLFSYAINCLNRLPVEFLMCYKFHVCFPQVDSTQAHCVRPCPVIGAGLGRTSAKEKPFAFSSLQLSVLVGYCAQVCLCLASHFYHNGINRLHLHCTSVALCYVQWRNVFVLVSSIHNKLERVTKQCAALLNRLSCSKVRSWTAVKGHLWVFVSSKCRISLHSGAFTCRSQTLLPIQFNA